jgi:hypothetical protein
LSNSLKLLNSEQSNAYQIAIDNFVANDKQIIMFISGESGTGKTMLANMIARGAQCLFNTSNNHNEFNRKSSGSVICTASTGVGAFKIEGHLWQRVLEKSFRYFQKKLSDVTIKKLQARFKHVKVFILDEVNTISLEDLQEINFRLCAATGDYTKPFGGLHVIMLGDFYQLYAVQGTPIARQDNEISNTRALHGKSLFKEMTHYVCLTLIHRGIGFLGPLATLVRNGRQGGNSPLDVQNTSTMVLHNLASKAMRTTHSGNEMDNSVLQKMERDLRNETIFLIAYHKPAETWRSRYLDMATKSKLCTVKGRQGRFDGLIAPIVIDICVGSRVRLAANILPCVGLFTGATGTVVGVIYRGERQNQPLLSCLASQENELPMVLVRMDGDDETFPHSCMNDVSRVVPIFPVASKQRIVLKGVGFIRYQIPITLYEHAHISPALLTAHSFISNGLCDIKQSVTAEYCRLNSLFQ